MVTQAEIDAGAIELYKFMNPRADLDEWDRHKRLSTALYRFNILRARVVLEAAERIRVEGK